MDKTKIYRGLYFIFNMLATLIGLWCINFYYKSDPTEIIRPLILLVFTFINGMIGVILVIYWSKDV